MLPYHSTYSESISYIPRNLQFQFLLKWLTYFYRRHNLIFLNAVVSYGISMNRGNYLLGIVNIWIYCICAKLRGLFWFFQHWGYGWFLGDYFYRRYVIGLLLNFLLNLPPEFFCPHQYLLVDITDFIYIFEIFLWWTTVFLI